MGETNAQFRGGKIRRIGDLDLLPGLHIGDRCKTEDLARGNGTRAGTEKRCGFCIDSAFGGAIMQFDRQDLIFRDRNGGIEFADDLESEAGAVTQEGIRCC